MLSAKSYKFSVEHRHNISEALMDRKFSEEHRHNLSKALVGRKLSKEHKQNTSKGRKKYYAKMTKEDRLRSVLPWIIASQKANPSSIEKKIWKVLDELGIEYEIQVPFSGNLFIADIYIPSKKLIIECNGDYWHNYKLFPESERRDKAFEKYAIRYGYKIIWLWESRINKNSKQALKDELDKLDMPF